MVRMRTTKGKRNKRRSHHGVTTSLLRHHASRKTGMYRGRQVFVVKQKQRDETTSSEEKATTEVAEAPSTPTPVGGVEK